VPKSDPLVDPEKAVHPTCVRRYTARLPSIAAIKGRLGATLAGDKGIGGINAVRGGAPGRDRTCDHRRRVIDATDYGFYLLLRLQSISLEMLG
jgi:hypothetical protein